MPISDTVGNSGVNQVDDVARIQSLLNEFRTQNGRAPISVDGLVGPETIGAIRDFQQAVTKIVDGRVDPDGPAITKLEALVAPRIFEASVLGMLGVLSEYDPRLANIHSDRTVSEVMKTLGGKRVG